jgi:hypothetical protein
MLANQTCSCQPLVQPEGTSEGFVRPRTSSQPPLISVNHLLYQNSLLFFNLKTSLAVVEMSTMMVAAAAVGLDHTSFLNFKLFRF